MSHAPLGSLSVHRLGFGAMQLPGPRVFGPPRDHDAAIAVLRRAVELGVDHIDTAQFYGPDVANALIREALHPYPARLALVSKVGARRDEAAGWLRDDEPAELRAGIEDNLRSLGVEQLAAVNLRVMDRLLDSQLDAMAQARQDGLIAGVGLSNVTLEKLRHALDITDIACVQNLLNLIDRTSLPVLQECERRGIAFVPFFPLGSGFGVDAVRDDSRVTATATRLDVTPSQVALAWLLALSPAILLIPGTSSVEHLEPNLAAGGVVLDDQARRDLDLLQ